MIGMSRVSFAGIRIRCSFSLWRDEMFNAKIDIELDEFAIPISAIYCFMPQVLRHH
jgi:hypothetical protein